MSTTPFLASPEYLEHVREAAEVAGLAIPAFVVPGEHHVVLGRMRFRYLDWGTAGRRPLLFPYNPRALVAELRRFLDGLGPAGA